MARRAIVLKHAAFEGPAAIAPLLAARGYALDVCDLHAGASVPSRIDSGDVLVVMGGPMGVGDVDDPAFPFLGPEVELLRRVIADDSPVLGVCLGAQLLAHAAGAAVFPATDAHAARVYEVGWAPVRFIASGAGDRIVAGLPTEVPVLHWHGDTFDLPPGARLFASTGACPQQGFQLGRRAFGLQFHCEVGRDEIEAFLAHDGAFAVRANGADAVARIRRDTERHLPTFMTVGKRLLDNILDAMTA